MMDAMTTTIRASRIHGRGLFTTTPIGRGAVIDRGPVLPFLQDEAGSSELLERYAFDFDGSGLCLVLGAASLCNHSDDPNAEVDIDDVTRTYRLLTLRPLRRGEEVCIDYGAEYWEAHPGGTRPRRN